MRNVLNPARQVSQNSLQLFRIRPGAQDPILRTPEFRRRNGFHRLRELLRILDRTNAPPNI
jgi:hypothetical protein